MMFGGWLHAFHTASTPAVEEPKTHAGLKQTQLVPHLDPDFSIARNLRIYSTLCLLFNLSIAIVREKRCGGVEEISKIQAGVSFSLPHLGVELVWRQVWSFAERDHLLAAQAARPTLRRVGVTHALVTERFELGSLLTKNAP